MNEETIKKNLGIIPEFYFDLISRIPAGIFLFVMVLLEFKCLPSLEGDWYLKIEVGFSFLILLSLLCIGQCLGIFLSVVGKHIARIFFTSNVWKKYAENDKELIFNFIDYQKIKSIDKEKFSEWKDNEYQKIYRESHDLIKDKNEKAMLLLPKLSAESSLCNNISASIFLSLIIHFIHRALYSSMNYLSWNYYVWVVVVFLFVVWIAKERYDRLIKSHISFLRNILNVVETHPKRRIVKYYRTI